MRWLKSDTQLCKLINSVQGENGNFLHAVMGMCLCCHTVVFCIVVFHFTKKSLSVCYGTSSCDKLWVRREKHSCLLGLLNNRRTLVTALRKLRCRFSSATFVRANRCAAVSLLKVRNRRWRLPGCVRPSCPFSSSAVPFLTNSASGKVSLRSLLLYNRYGYG